MITIDNVKTAPASVRRKQFLAEVAKRQRESSLTYKEAFDLVMADQEFGGKIQLSNDGAGDERLKGASDRRLQLEKKVKEHMELSGASRENALQHVWKKNPELVGHNSILMPKGGLMPMGLEGSMPKVNMQPVPVGDWDRKTGVTVRPYVPSKVVA